jgi:small-conductance mechanosensitive channel
LPGGLRPLERAFAFGPRGGAAIRFDPTASEDFILALPGKFLTPKGQVFSSRRGAAIDFPEMLRLLGRNGREKRITGRRGFSIGGERSMNQESVIPILERVVFGNTVRVYAEALVFVLVISVVLEVIQRIVIGRLGRMAAKTENKLDDYIVERVKKIGRPVYILIGLYLATRSFKLSPTMDRLIDLAFMIFLTIQVIQLFQGILTYLIARSHLKMRADDPNREAVVRNLSFAIGLVLWIAGAVFVLDNMGIKITGLVAGLGIGGVAVALAAQAVLQDAFSSFSIFLDRPFEVGDFIIVGDLMGVVENVGFKTTRLRSLSGEQLVFSNKDLTSSRIRNYKRMRERRIAFTIGAVYQTSLSKMQKIPPMIAEIFKTVDLTRFDRAHFKAFGAFSLDIEIVYYVLSPDYNKYMDIQQEINFKIMEAFEREGIEFAYPTQTLYLEKGEGGQGSA